MTALGGALPAPTPPRALVPTGMGALCCVPPVSPCPHPGTPARGQATSMPAPPPVCPCGGTLPYGITLSL